MQPDSLSGGQDALKLKSRGGVVRVFKAAGYSLAGLRAAFIHEAAFRQLLLLAAALIPLAFWLTDESFAVVHRHYLDPHPPKELKHWYYLGSCLAMYSNWFICTLLGALLGNALPGLADWGLDFAMVATFTGIVVPLLRTRPMLLAAVVALLAALVAVLEEVARVLKPGGRVVFGTKPASAAVGKRRRKADRVYVRAFSVLSIYSVY